MLQKIIFSISIFTIFANSIQATEAESASSESDLSLYEVGGQYFSTCYAQKTFELALNGWYEDDEPGISLYAGYALTDNVTLKLEVPGGFTSPFLSGGKITGVIGKQKSDKGLSVAADIGLESYLGDGWHEFIPFAGFNAAKRSNLFGFLGRIGVGLDIYTESETSIDPNLEMEAGAFVYTGEVGMIGIPLMLETAGQELSFNIGLDWEVYLPMNFSLSIIPRYELVGESGLSGWFGISWMMIP